MEQVMRILSSKQLLLFRCGNSSIIKTLTLPRHYDITKLNNFNERWAIEMTNVQILLTEHQQGVGKAVDVVLILYCLRTGTE